MLNVTTIEELVPYFRVTVPVQHRCSAWRKQKVAN